jgi:hypothetical protein
MVPSFDDILLPGVFAPVDKTFMQMASSIRHSKLTTWLMPICFGFCSALSIHTDEKRTPTCPFCKARA